MTQRLVIIGAGGFGRETLDVVEAANHYSTKVQFLISGVVDDMPSRLSLSRLKARQVNWLGTIKDWLETAADELYLLGIGDPCVRARLDDQFIGSGLTAATVVHPAATLGSNCKLAPGTVICSGAQISTNVSLGRHTHINPNATIGHDAVLAPYVSVNPAATVSGEVSIGTQTVIGAGAVILQGISIGAHSIVGAAACVTHDVGEAQIVKGVPAR